MNNGREESEDDKKNYLLSEVRQKFTTQASAVMFKEHEKSLHEEISEVKAGETPPSTSTPEHTIDSRLDQILDRLSLSSNEPRRYVSSPQVHKWNLHYYGGPGLSSQARGIRDAQLFESAMELLQGDTLTWLTIRSSRLHTWKELVTALKSTFLLFDYECDLRNEIRNRTQGSVFNRLPTKPSELEIVRLIRRNLLPYLQQGLGIE